MVVSGPLIAAELKPATLEAWNQYINAADAGMHARLDRGSHFLWTDEAPDRAARLRQGEILVAPMNGSGTRRVPDGLIHHWVGAVFVPGALLDDVLAVTHAYGRYKQIYGPKIVESRLLTCEDGQQSYRLLWLNDVLFSKVALETQYRAQDFPVDSRRFYNIAHVTDSREIEGYGQPQERALPPGAGNGFIWRVDTIVRYEQRDGGVYVELEALALTRDIPGSLRWMAAPLVSRLSRSTLAASLRQTREAALAPPSALPTATACRTSQTHAVAVADGTAPYLSTRGPR
jgi:hypothetical protein